MERLHECLILKQFPSFGPVLALKIAVEEVFPLNFMQKVICGLVAGGALLGSIDAKAITFSDFDSIQMNLTAVGGTSLFAGDFNILDDGFVPGNYTISSATITFTLGQDFSSATSSFLINLDGIYDNSQFTSFVVLGTDQIGIDLLTSLNADGVLTYNISATSGDFWLESASLTAEADRNQLDNRNPVPDTGSTLALTAIAFSGLLLFRKQIAKLA